MLLVGNVILVCWVASASGFWQRELIADTIFWFGATGLLTFGNAPSVANDPAFFRKVLLRATGVVVLIEVAANLYTFAYWLELALVIPGLTVLGLVEAVAVHQARSDPTRGSKLVAGCFSYTLAFIGLLLLARVLWLTIGSSDQLDWGLLLRSVAWPGVLAVATTPYFYLLALAVTYETTFLRLRFAAPRQELPRHVRLAVLVGFHVNVWQLGRVTGLWHRLIATAPNFRECLRIITLLHRTPRGQELDAAYRLAYPDYAAAPP